jgi:hypothetical protein
MLLLILVVHVETGIFGGNIPEERSDNRGVSRRVLEILEKTYLRSSDNRGVSRRVPEYHCDTT